MKLPFPWLALGLGLVIALVLLVGGALAAPQARALPLLTLLIVTEFGFFLSAIGALLSLRKHPGGRSVAVLAAGFGCLLLAGGFFWLGLQLWPGGMPSAG